MVVVQPLPVNGAEPTDRNRLDEANLKEPRNLCSKGEEVASGSKDESEVPVPDETPDQNESNCDSLNALKGRSVRPAKRKQVSEKQAPYKRPRGILKLRSKTIRIMK